MSSRKWDYGDVVALRYVPSGSARWIKPVRVVEDTAGCVALYLAADTPLKKPVHRHTGEQINRRLSYIERFSIDWVLGDGVWADNAVLMLTRPGTAHSFWAFWRGHDWTFLGWYVNFQDPLRRTDSGVDTADHVLDLVIDPDLRSWRWKDEDEFEEACSVGRFTDAERTAIAREREAVVAIVRSRSWPLDVAWSTWQPDPAWTVPTLADILA